MHHSQHLPSPPLPVLKPMTPRLARVLIGDDFDSTADLEDQPLPANCPSPSVAEGLLKLRFVLPRAA